MKLWLIVTRVKSSDEKKGNPLSIEKEDFTHVMFIFYEERKYIMFGALWGFFVVLVVLWLLGFVVFHVTSFLIHLLLVLAVIVLVYNLVMRSRTRRL